jgi:hypothetical protein
MHGTVYIYLLPVEILSPSVLPAVVHAILQPETLETRNQNPRLKL